MGKGKAEVRRESRCGLSSEVETVRNDRHAGNDQPASDDDRSRAEMVNQSTFTNESKKGDVVCLKKKRRC